MGTTGETPAWVAALTDDDLRRQFGAEIFARGLAYARQGAVTDVQTGGEGTLLLAAVSGNRPAPYQVLVTSPAKVSKRISARCSCPMGTGCKHIVAALLNTRGLKPRHGARPSWPHDDWEHLLDNVIARPKPAAPTPMALQFELVQPRNSPGRRIRLRAMAQGKTGWIKTGASWRDLESRYQPPGRPTISAEQRAWVFEVLSVARSHQTHYYSQYADVILHLEDLGTATWRLLAAAQRAGFTFIGTGATTVELAAEPARPVIDLRRADGGDVELTAALRLDDGEVLPPGADLIGEPAHGCAIDEPGRLRLIPLEPQIDASIQRLLNSGRVVIPAAETPRFLTEFYPALQRQLTVESADASVALPRIEPPRLSVRIDFEPGHVATIASSFVYRVGDQTHEVAIDDTVPDASRDVDAERALLSRLTALDAVPGLRAPAHEGRRLIPQAQVTGLHTADLAERVLPALADDPDVEVVVQGDATAYHESADAPLVTVALDDDANDPDWFNLAVAVTVDGEHVPFPPLFAAMSLGQERLLLDSGTWFRLDRPELRRLRELIDEAKAIQDKTSGALRLTPVQAGLWEELVQLGVVTQQSERWARTAGALLALEEMPRPDPPVGLKAQLRPYQLDGYQWLSLLWDLQLGGVLADDMGLGKTVQTLAMAVRAREAGSLGGESGPLLIVTPTSVMSTWASQAAQFAPDLDVRIVPGTQRKTSTTVAEHAAGADLVITSFTLFRLDEEAYRSVKWSGLVLDEAQFVKNHQAKTYQCARRLPAPFKLAITGTPLENTLMDLWSMLSIVAPGLFPNPERFNEFYRRPIERGEAPDRLDALRRRIRPLMLRRTKELVASDLPPKTEQRLDVELNPQHRRIYDTHLNRERQRVMHLVEDMDRNRLTILRSLTLLRQLSLDASLVDEEHAGKVRSSKIDALVDQLREIAAEGHRALVFSQFTRFLSLIRTRLTEEGLGHCYLDGRTRDRAARIAEFTEGDAPVFLISLKAGGFGLNLTAADYVFVLDPWWNPAAEEQAIDRTHRIGQDKPVMVYRLVATDTIEEKVVALQERKRDLFAQVVDGGAAASGALTAADIRELFAS
ncbi:MAG TPA: DEAD/DEAH box helicase [Mycobacteriales bacterium]|nr:DEAD/DEAH box helicase [Mycobacteriales bacterium]